MNKREDTLHGVAMADMQMVLGMPAASNEDGLKVGVHIVDGLMDVSP